MKIYESRENYLETIYILNKKLKNVRSIDIANELSFSKPSVSVAMKNLKNGGYITIDEDGYIKLTHLGLDVAKKTFERHTVIKEILISLGVSEETAADDACRIEHDLSDESFEKIKEFFTTRT